MFVFQNTSQQETKKVSQDWEKISYKHISDKDLYVDYTTHSYNSITGRQTSHKKCAKGWNRYFTKEDI